ncbi:MAG: hypothetical protein NTY22_08760, partial [Proteobacteria bacterium]|nr:hypothetical protein [Pseudomonadota bacterium]
IIGSVAAVIKADKATEVLRQERMKRIKRTEEEDNAEILRAEIEKRRGISSEQSLAYIMMIIAFASACIGFIILLSCG